MSRIENLNIESVLEGKRKLLEDQMKDLKSEEKRIFYNITLCKKEIEDFEVDVEFLTNFYKYSGFEEKYNRMMGRKSQQDNESYDKMMKLKKLLDVHNKIEI